MPHATGPLTPVIQVALSPVTHLRPPGIRITNIILLTVIVALIAATLRNRAVGFAWAKALAIMSLPTTWIVSGLALDRNPSHDICRLGRGRNQSPAGRFDGHLNLRVAIVAAVAIALASLGRQPFLLVGIVMPLAYGTAGIAGCRSPSLAAQPGANRCCMHIVGRSYPPKASSVGSGIAISHSVLAFAYAGAFVLLFAPRWFRWPGGLGWLLGLADSGQFDFRIYRDPANGQCRTDAAAAVTRTRCEANCGQRSHGARDLVRRQLTVARVEPP